MNKTIDTALKVNPGAGNLKPDTKVGRASDAYTKAFWQAFRGKDNIQEIKDTLTIGSDPEGGTWSRMNTNTLWWQPPGRKLLPQPGPHHPHLLR